MKRIRGFIFDIDGTLLDSNEAHAVSWWEALRDLGYALPIERVRRAIGMGEDHLVPALTGLAEDSELIERIGREKGRHFDREYARDLRAFPDARDLLVELRERGYRLAVATSADRKEMDAFLDRVGAADLFDAKVCADDVDGSKPDPDVVSAALRKLGLKSSEVYFVGDTPYDVEAARKAGVSTLAVRSGGNSDESLRGAARVFEDVREIHRRIREGWDPSA